MFYSRLLMLNDIIEDSKVINLQNYLASLNQNNSDKITLSKIVKAIECNEEEAALILNKCVENGILSLSFGVRCPECGMLIKKIESADIKSISITECYNCEEEIEITENDIVALFSLKVDVPPFDLGQREEDVKSNPDNQVALCDTVNALSIFGFDEKILEKYDIHIHNHDVIIKKELLKKKREKEKTIDGLVNKNHKFNLTLVSILLLSSLVFGCVLCFLIYQINSQKNDQINNIISLWGLAIVPIVTFFIHLFIPTNKDDIRKNITERYKYEISDIEQQIEDINNNYR